MSSIVIRDTLSFTCNINSVFRNECKQQHKLFPL